MPHAESRSPQLETQSPSDAAARAANAGLRSLKFSNVLLILTAAVGMIAIWIDVEYVLAVGPAVTALGLAMASVGVCRRSSAHVGLGLSQLLFTGAVALLIGVGHLGPNDAQIPVGMLFSANVLLVEVWGFYNLARLRRADAAIDARAETIWSRISLREIVVGTTLFCVAAGILSNTSLRGDWPIFIVYGQVMILLVAIAAHRYYVGSRKSPR